MTMMESTTTIDLTETAAPQATSIDEIHIETIEERLHSFYFLLISFRFIAVLYMHMPTAFPIDSICAGEYFSCKWKIKTHSITNSVLCERCWNLFAWPNFLWIINWTDKIAAIELQHFFFYKRSLSNSSSSRSEKCTRQIFVTFFFFFCCSTCELKGMKLPKFKWKFH